MIEVYNFFDVNGATHKEVGVSEIVDDAVAKGLEGIVVISSGNFVFAISEELERRELDLRLYNLVNRQPVNEGEVQIPTGVILASRESRVEFVKASGIDTSNIEDYTDFIPNAYSQHAEKILAGSPDYVVCPIGSGKLWKSIVDQVEEKGLITRVIGIAPRNCNPFFTINESGKTSVADKLTAPYTALREEVLSYSPKHHVVQVSERQLKQAYKQATSDGIECELSAAAGFVVYDKKFKSDHNISSDDYVKVISTGKGMVAHLNDFKNEENKSPVKKLGVISGVLGGFLAMFINSFTPYDSNLKHRFFEYLSEDGTGRMALEYVSESTGKVISQLNEKDLSDALTLQYMDSNGTDFIYYSLDPRKKMMYEDFAMRCSNHGRPDFQKCKPRI